MLVGNTHWSHRLPGGRWFETLPHELYLIHFFEGPLCLSDVSALHTSRAPSGAPADEVSITLKNNRCLASIHYSANCGVNWRTLTLYGSKGVISVDLLSDFAYLSNVQDKKWRRAVARPLIEAGGTLLSGIANRPRYFVRQIRSETPHARVIQAFAKYVQGTGPSPAPIGEIDYVVRNCDQIGREIDRQLNEQGLSHAAG